MLIYGFSWVGIVVQAGHKYRSDIDGLRAVAVLPVVFYHAGFSTFSGGFVGVDVFFVISGFLITSIIAREISAESFSLASFYERRARRLFPALFSMIGVSAVVACFLLMPWELEDFGESVATTSVFVSNFLFFNEAGYFDGPAELKPLLHTWSLAIEEQYYLLFPGVLLLAHKFAPGRFLAITVGLLVLSFAISVWSTLNAPDAAFYLLPSRTWELMVGSVLALIGAPVLSNLVRSALGSVGLAMILIAVFSYGPETTFPGVGALLPCLGTGLIILAGIGIPSQETKQPITVRLLSWRPLVGVGLISYSLYLWHWPVLVFAKHYLMRPLALLEATVLVLLSFVLAYLSWRFVEKPFRGRDAVLTQRGIFQLATSAIVLLIAAGLVMDQTEGLPGRLPVEVARIADVANDKPPNRRRCEGIKPEDFSYERLCRVNELDVEPSFLVWGDSHAMSVMPEIGKVASELGLNGLDASSNGCIPLLGVTRPVRDLREECLGFSSAVRSLLADHEEVSKVIMISRWARHAEGNVFGDEDGETYLMATADKVATNATENLEIYHGAFSDTLRELEALGKEVVVVGAIPEAGQPVPDVLAKSLWHGQPIELGLTRDAYMHRQRNVDQVFTRLQQDHDFRFVESSPYFCDQSECKLVSETGMPLYFDDNHLSSTGARRLTEMFNTVLSVK